MEELILVRHGYSQHMALKMAGGWAPTPMTDLGRRQAQRTAERLREELAGRPVRVVASDLLRTVETARAIGGALGLEPELTAALREQSLGVANEMTHVQADEVALNPTTGPEVDRVWYPGAETWREMMHRVFTCLDQLDHQTHGTLLVVSHNGAGTCVVYWWLRLFPGQWPAIQFELDLCSITTLRIGDHNGRRLVRLNDTSHLAGVE
jgi:probable phosphoglycerate mutase